MRKLISFICALCLLGMLTVMAAADDGVDAGWQSAYRSVLDQIIAERDPRFSEEVTQENSYLLYDVDKDGVPELIVKMGTCEADYTGVLYTFRDETAVKVDEFGLGHSSLYSDPGENGILVYYGHMAYAYGMHVSLENGELNGEQIFEDDLYSRLLEDENADYVPVENFVPGACYLDLYEAKSNLPLARYEEMERYRAGDFPGATEEYWPDHDGDYYKKIISENAPVIALALDPFSNCPGQIGFQDLLKKDVAAPWMSGDLQIFATREADLNGDGKIEYVVDLTESDESRDFIIRCYLTEQDGTVYAYLQNYAPHDLSIDGNGNLLESSEYYTSLHRIVFDGEICGRMTLPLSYLTEGTAIGTTE